MTDIPMHELPLMDEHIRPGVRVLEFGDKRNPSGLYRDWYLLRGVASYVSVDINGRNGVVQMDVRTPFDLGQFDVVTNWGFSEHVSEQRPFWENAYNALEVGGVFVGTLPKPREWVNHGWSYWHPTDAFFTAWASANAMEIVEIKPCGPPHRGLASMTGYVMRRQSAAPHVWESEFNALFWRNPSWEIPADNRVLYGDA